MSPYRSGLDLETASERLVAALNREATAMKELAAAEVALAQAEADAEVQRLRARGKLASAELRLQLVVARSHANRVRAGVEPTAKEAEGGDELERAEREAEEARWAIPASEHACRARIQESLELLAEAEARAEAAQVESRAAQELLDRSR